jgi:hypothetical protein
MTSVKRQLFPLIPSRSLLFHSPVYDDLLVTRI